MKSTVTIKADRIVLTLPKLADFDAEYPAVEEDAIAREINLVDVFRGSEFITQINVERYRKSQAVYAAAYTAYQLRANLPNSQN